MIEFGKFGVGLWKFELGFVSECWRMSWGWRTFHFGLFKLTQEPPEGCDIAKGDYIGFRFRLRVWLPFEFVR